MAYVPVEGHVVVLKRGSVEVVVVDNAAEKSAQLPQHRRGYSGVAAIRHDANHDDDHRQDDAAPRNLFVPEYAGLNFEHIHDGTTQDRDILFEPRVSPNRLRRIDDHTVELYQPPTETWGVESCQRYELLPDGTVQLSVELIPRRATFRHGYMGLFWASYIDQPESKDIFFRGVNDGAGDTAEWIRGVTPAHGKLSTHLGVEDRRAFEHDADFPLTLVFNNSRHTYIEPWYYGVSHGMAYVLMFRPQDEVRFTQSPSGGGDGNPAWDFQYLVDDVKVDRLYRFVVRAMYTPFESPKQIERDSAAHREALGQANRSE
ncbi:MAG: hypothetical protein KDA63_06415 [Planctomycetales bacterium]|nr:hypothetical protein [Planctomycetales bacterium]